MDVPKLGCRSQGLSQDEVKLKEAIAKVTCLVLAFPCFRDRKGWGSKEVEVVLLKVRLDMLMSQISQIDTTAQKYSWLSKVWPVRRSKQGSGSTEIVAVLYHLYKQLCKKDHENHSSDL
jgi:hypothetical protein